MPKRRGVLQQNDGHCIYTGRLATSADHVPPKSFLARPLPVDLPTVPSCANFNSSAAHDEQYFMAILGHIGHHPALAWRIIDGGDIDRALTRRPALDERLISEIEAGADGRPAITPDWSRIAFVLQKLAAGLFFLKFRRAPGLASFSAISLYGLNDPPQVVADLSWKFEHVEPMKVIQWSIFSYGFCNQSDSHTHTYCNINFYDSLFGLIACPYEALPSSRDGHQANVM
jgi:hypothetical protein